MTWYKLWIAVDASSFHPKQLEIYGESSINDHPTSDIIDKIKIKHLFYDNALTLYKKQFLLQKPKLVTLKSLILLIVVALISVIKLIVLMSLKIQRS